MATVRVLTADHMEAMEAEMVVDGEVVGDNLVLVTRSGQQIDVGSVRGPMGPAGGPGSTLPEGDTWAVRTGNGQLLVGPATSPSGATPKSYVDNLVIGVELETSDLNALKYRGTYFQTENAESTGALNYPTPGQAGMLEVFTNESGSLVYQRWMAHGDLGQVFYLRVYWSFNDTWYPWYRHAVPSDTGWVPVEAGSFATGFANDTGGNATPLAYRVINGVEMWWRGRVTTPTLNPNTSYTIATLGAQHPAPTALNNSGAIATTGAFLGWANYANNRVLNTHFKSPWVAATAVLDLSGLKVLLN